MLMTTDIPRKIPIPSEQEEDLQQALMLAWVHLLEQKNPSAELEALLEESIRPGLPKELVQAGYLTQTNGQAVLSESGERLGKEMARRHRLTERLLQDVLGLPLDGIARNTCLMEHVVGADVEAAICTLLGHPQSCPHGYAIPPGRCCQEAPLELEAIIVPLSSLRAGQSGRIAYLAPLQRPELHRLLSMGFVPGAEIKVSQTYPALVVCLGETMVALDPVVGQQVLIRRGRP